MATNIFFPPPCEEGMLGGSVEDGGTAPMFWAPPKAMPAGGVLAGFTGAEPIVVPPNGALGFGLAEGDGMLEAVGAGVYG